MANERHLRIISSGSEAWNQWREEHPQSPLDLSEVDLRQANLAGANLVGVDLNHTDLSRADLTGASLVDADLSGALFFDAKLSRARLDGADLTGANLRGANLESVRAINANFTDADLRGAKCQAANFSHAILSQAKLDHANFSLAELKDADLTGASLVSAQFTNADLTGGNLTNANLAGADLSKAILFNANLFSTTLDETILQEAELWATLFSSNDLSTVKGLLTVQHRGPSSIGIDTLFMSGGTIPQQFLRDAGVPDDFVTYVPSLVSTAIEFYSCFISHSHLDEDFSERLYSRMRCENLRVWYAPEDIRGGGKLHEQIFRAIQVHDKLLIVLSVNSMKSEWVITEIRRARKIEREENRRKLFPIRLIDFETLERWECFDADSGKDLAIEVREYYIPDFSNWRDEEAFQVEFAKLLRDLRSSS